MAITIDATYEDGVLKPAEPLPFDEHAQVRVTVVEPVEEDHVLSAEAAEPSIASLAEEIAARARSLPPGALDSLPDDLAAEHDHYLYGTPKRHS